MFIDSTVDVSSGSTDVTMNSTADVRPGMSIVGANIADNTIVRNITNSTTYLGTGPVQITKLFSTSKPTNITSNQVYHILNKRLLIKTNKELLTYLSFTKNNFIKLSFNSNQIVEEEKYINPLLWQMGHVIFFYCELVLKNLYHCKNININNYEKYAEFYDSFKNILTEVRNI